MFSPLKSEPEVRTLIITNHPCVCGTTLIIPRHMPQALRRTHECWLSEESLSLLHHLIEAFNRWRARPTFHLTLRRKARCHRLRLPSVSPLRRSGASPGWGRGGVPGLAPPLYSGLPNEVRPWKAFHGIQGAVVVLGFETVSDAVDPHG